MDLFAPLTFPSGLTLRNRAALAPLTNKQSNADGSLGDDELHWLCSRAEGYGLVSTCAAHVSKDGQSWPGELGIFDDALLPGLTTLATAMHARGAAAFVQIFHGGGRADRAVSGHVPWSASESDGVRAATEANLERVAREFADAAARAQTAGFDGVEIHGAHGYLLTQFLSTTVNRRTNQWGGSLENRARLLRDVVRAVRAKVGRGFTVGVRLSPESFRFAAGLDLDESVQTAGWLAEDGVDFIHLSLWDALANSAKRPDTHPLPLFRTVVPAPIAIVAAGSVWTKPQAESVLTLGADVVAVGRAAIANADWALKAHDPAWEPRRPPVPFDELRASGLSQRFSEYMRSFQGFVAD